MKVTVDRELCIGIGNCIALAPTVFELDEENIAVILDPSSADDDALVEAAESCPMLAIIIEDDEGSQVYP